MGGLVKMAIYVSKLAGKATAKTAIAHPQWIVYKTTMIATNAVVAGVKTAGAIAGGLLIGHVFFGE